MVSGTQCGSVPRGARAVGASRPIRSSLDSSLRLRLSSRRRQHSGRSGLLASLRSWSPRLGQRAYAAGVLSFRFAVADGVAPARRPRAVSLVKGAAGKRIIDLQLAAGATPGRRGALSAPSSLHPARGTSSCLSVSMGARSVVALTASYWIGRIFSNGTKTDAGDANFEQFSSAHGSRARHSRPDAIDLGCSHTAKSTSKTADPDGRLAPTPRVLVAPQPSCAPPSPHPVEPKPRAEPLGWSLS